MIHIVTAGNFDCDEINMTLSDTAMRLHGIKLALSLKVSKPCITFISVNVDFTISTSDYTYSM